MKERSVWCKRQAIQKNEVDAMMKKKKKDYEETEVMVDIYILKFDLILTGDMVPGNRSCHLQMYFTGGCSNSRR